jgi:hypothetical protein
VLVIVSALGLSEFYATGVRGAHLFWYKTLAFGLSTSTCEAETPCAISAGRSECPGTNFSRAILAEQAISQKLKLSNGNSLADARKKVNVERREESGFWGSGAAGRLSGYGQCCPEVDSGGIGGASLDPAIKNAEVAGSERSF